MLDRSKCKKMLVWSSNKEDAVERIVIDIMSDGWCICVEHNYTEEFEMGNCFNAARYRHCKLIPEPKPMTPLDVMYWGGVRKVVKGKLSSAITSIIAFNSTFNACGNEWNELIHKNGETKLKYDEWKEFTFDECKM